jgi:serine/threonine protein kinase
MLQGELTSDSGFVDDVEVDTSTTFVDIEPLYSNPKTHSRLFTATLRGKRFVLKGLKDEYAAHPNYRELLNKEFEIGYHLSHPNIVATLGMRRVEGLGEVIAIEYVDGITLAEALDKGIVTKDVARCILSEICDAMHYMHSLQVIHRDLKPENIMLTHNGNHVKIIDFGLADSDSHTIFKQPAGTRRYASPELVEGDKIDNRSDIYSLGVIIGLMLHDKRALRISQRCMKERRDERFADALDVKNALLAKSRKPLYIGIVAALLLAVGIAIGGYNIGLHNAPIVDSRSDEGEKFQTAIVEVDNLIDSMLDAYYSRLPLITTTDELEIYVNEYFPLKNRIESLAEERYTRILDTMSPGFATYRAIISQYIKDRIFDYWQDNDSIMSELISRMYP